MKFSDGERGVSQVDSGLPGAVEMRRIGEKDKKLNAKTGYGEVEPADWFDDVGRV